MNLTDLKKLLSEKHQGRITEVNHHFSDYYTVKVAVEKGFTNE